MFDFIYCIIKFKYSKIKICLEKLSEKFGEKVDLIKKNFLFPEPEKLADASIKEIIKCGTGYRSKFIKSAAKMVVRRKR